MAYASVEKIIIPIFNRALGHVTGSEHLPSKPPYLIAANHIDYLDGFYVTAAVDRGRKHKVYFITKTKNYRWTQIAIPVDHSKRTSSLDVAFRHLKSGKVICNFIEGQRNSSGALLPGRTGTARLALLAQVPVIPVGLRGPSARNFAGSVANLIAQPKSVDVHIGAPVRLDDLYGAEHDTQSVRVATTRIMRSLARLSGKAFAD